MGLPISQNICKLLDTELNVISLVGSGSVFFFDLPIDKSELQVIKEERKSEVSDEISRSKDKLGSGNLVVAPNLG